MDDINNAEYQESLIREILLEKKKNNMEIDNVINFHKKYSSMLVVKKNTKIPKWRLMSIEFDNMICFRDGNFIDFNTLDGVTGLVAPNDTGKTSILDILIFGLYNEIRRGTTKDITNDHAPATCASIKIKIKVQISNNREKMIDFVDASSDAKETNKKEEKNKSSKKQRDVIRQKLLKEKEEQKNNEDDTERIKIYTINKRCVSNTTHKFETNIYTEGRELFANIKSEKEKYKRLSKIIGTYENFKKINIINEDTISLVDLDNKTKKDLSKIYNIDVFEDIITFVKTELKTTKDKLDNLEKIINVNENKNIENHDDTIRENKRQINALYSKNEKILEQKENLKQYNECGESEDNLQKELKELNELRESKTPTKSKDDLIKELKDEYKKYKTSVFSLAHTPKQSTETIGELIKKYDLSLQKLEQTNIQIFNIVETNQTNSVQYQQLKPEIIESYSILKNCIDQISFVMNDQNKKVDESVSNLWIKLKKQEELDLACMTRQSRIEYITTQLSNNEENKKSKSKSNALTEEYRKNIENIKKLEKQVFDCEKKKALIQGNQEVIDNVKEERTELIMYDEVLKNYKICIDSNNGIQNRILVRNMEKLIGKFNDILKAYEIDVTMFNDAFLLNGRPVELASGFQKYMFNICFRICLYQLSRKPLPDIIFIDEGFGKFDLDNIKKVPKIFELLKTHFRVVFVITHIESLFSCYNTILNINVKKHGEKNSESLISYGKEQR